jgi:DNA-binding NtrC family response regulator
MESRVGAFEFANGGTLFLDEVGELPLEVQPLLLRVLETGEFTPLGSNEMRRVEVRVIAATNRAIDERVAAGAFRSDLLYRLAVVRLNVPALRERPADIRLLARHFACRAGIAELPAGVLSALEEHTWPGNVRELRNAIDAYAALGALPPFGGTELDLLDLALRRAVTFDEPLLAQRDRIADRFARTYLELLLARCGDNQSEASRLAGVERSHFRRLLAKHDLLAKRERLDS